VPAPVEAVRVSRFRKGHAVRAADEPAAVPAIPEAGPTKSAETPARLGADLLVEAAEERDSGKSRGGGAQPVTQAEAMADAAKKKETALATRPRTSARRFPRPSILREVAAVEKTDPAETEEQMDEASAPVTVTVATKNTAAVAKIVGRYRTRGEAAAPGIGPKEAKRNGQFAARSASADGLKPATVRVSGTQYEELLTSLKQVGPVTTRASAPRVPRVPGEARTSGKRPVTDTLGLTSQVDTNLGYAASAAGAKTGAARPITVEVHVVDPPSPAATEAAK
jgi:hypothetical protein